MKKTVSFICLICMFLTSYAAQKAMGTLHMKDGSKYSSVEIELPAGTVEELKIKLDGKKIKIKSNDVDSLIVWHKSNPDDKYLMRYSKRREIDYEKGEDKIEKYSKWFVLKNTGKYVSVWVYACMVDVTKSGITTAPCDTKYGYNTFYNFWKNGDLYPVYMKYNRKTEKTEAWCAMFFSDDETLSNKILDKQYRAESYKESRRFGTMLCDMMLERIANDYSPAK